MIRTIMLYNGVFYRFSPVFWNRYCLRTNIRAYFCTKRGLVFIQLSVIRDNIFSANKCSLYVLIFDLTLVAEL